jgi:hypothetical protein
LSKIITESLGFLLNIKEVEDGTKLLSIPYMHTQMQYIHRYINTLLAAYIFT